MTERGVAPLALFCTLPHAEPLRSVVMPGLDPGIHSVTSKPFPTDTEWIAGSSPAMTTLLR